MHDALDHAQQGARHLLRAGDALSLGALAAAFLDYAPHLGGGLAVVWWCVRIYYEIRAGERKLWLLRRPPQ